MLQQVPTNFSSQAVSTYKQVQQFYQANDEKRHHASAAELNYTNPLLPYQRNIDEGEESRSKTQVYNRTSGSRERYSYDQEKSAKARVDSFERGRASAASNERAYRPPTTQNLDLSHDLGNYRDNEPLRQFERTSDKGAIKYGSPAIAEPRPVHEFERQQNQPDPIEEYQMLRERREREQRSHSSGVNRSA
jgi:hypothetical protein